MALRRIRSTWYVYFRDERGRLTTRSLHVHDADTARRLERRFMEQLRARKARAMIAREFPELAPAALPPVPEPPRRGGLRISDLFERAAARRALSATHKSAFKAFASWCAGHGLRYAVDITPQIAQAFLDERYSGGNGKTYNNVRTCLNTLFRCVLVDARLPASPFAAIINRRVLQTETHRNLTGEEFERLMAVLEPDLAVCAMLSRWTCQRLETCLRITPEMIDLERLVFCIEPGKTRRFKKWVCVPIMPELESFLRPLLPQCTPGTPICETFASRRMASYAWSHAFTGAFRRAGINDTEAGKASFHSLRGTGITWFKEHGVRGEDLRSITGHASDDVEDIYARDIANLARIAREFRASIP